MTTKKPYTLKIDRDLLDALKAIKERDGIGESEQIRRGIRLWLAQKGAAKALGKTVSGASRRRQVGRTTRTRS